MWSGTGIAFEVLSVGRWESFVDQGWKMPDRHYAAYFKSLMFFGENSIAAIKSVKITKQGRLVLFKEDSL